jgi:hypothetical protein
LREGKFRGWRRGGGKGGGGGEGSELSLTLARIRKSLRTRGRRLLWSARQAPPAPTSAPRRRGGVPCPRRARRPAAQPPPPPPLPPETRAPHHCPRKKGPVVCKRVLNRSSPLCFRVTRCPKTKRSIFGSLRQRAAVLVVRGLGGGGGADSSSVSRPASLHTPAARAGARAGRLRMRERTRPARRRLEGARRREERESAERPEERESSLERAPRPNHKARRSPCRFRSSAAATTTKAPPHAPSITCTPKLDRDSRDHQTSLDSKGELLSSQTKKKQAPLRRAPSTPTRPTKRPGDRAICFSKGVIGNGTARVMAKGRARARGARGGAQTSKFDLWVEEPPLLSLVRAPGPALRSLPPPPAPSRARTSPLLRQVIARASQKPRN